AGVWAVITTRPLLALVDAARRIQGTDLQSPVPRSGPRELQELGAALDDMRLAIRAAREQLLGQNAQLEGRAQQTAAVLSERAQDLAVMNAIASDLMRARAGGPALTVERVVR